MAEGNDCRVTPLSVTAVNNSDSWANGYLSSKERPSQHTVASTPIYPLCYWDEFVSYHKFTLLESCFSSLPMETYQGKLNGVNYSSLCCASSKAALDAPYLPLLFLILYFPPIMLMLLLFKLSYLVVSHTTSLPRGLRPGSQCTSQAVSTVLFH